MEQVLDALTTGGGMSALLYACMVAAAALLWLHWRGGGELRHEEGVAPARAR